MATSKKAARATFGTEKTIQDVKETVESESKTRMFDIDSKSVTSIVCGNESVFIGRGVKSVEITFSDNVR